MSTSRILVTGANGFVGSAVCAELLARGFGVRAAHRRPEKFQVAGCEIARVETLDANTDWSNALRGISTVIHLAARVHVMRDKSSNPLEEFRRMNVAGTKRLADCAAANGVKRLVYVSSIKVNGEETRDESKFTEVDIPNPQDPYGISKNEAEQALRHVEAETGLEVVIVRPPLVYGPEVKGNFAQMLKVLKKGIPLPLASVHNRRSLIYLGNLVDALLLCATHPAATGRTYLVSDGEDVSTAGLVRMLGEAMGRPARLLPVPVWMLRLAGRLTGRSAAIERLTGSLCVDDAAIRRELGWQPPYTLEQGLRETAAKFVSHAAGN